MLINLANNVEPGPLTNASRPSYVYHLNIQIKGIEDWPFECTYSLIACMLNKIEEVRILVQNNPFSIFSLML